MDKTKRIVKVTITGQEFALKSSAPETYVHRVANMVDAEVAAVRETLPSLSAMESVILASTNLADKYIYAKDEADALRAQITDYIAEASKYKSELSEARREISRLKKGK